MPIDYRASNRFISLRLLANELSTNPPEDWAGLLADVLELAPACAAERERVRAESDARLGATADRK